MITLVTNTTSVIELTAYPFTGSVQRRGKETPVLAIPCSPSMTLDDVKERFNDTASTVRMVLMDGGTLIREYTDYTKMEEISMVPADVDDDGKETPSYYVVKMSQKVTFEEELLTMKKTMSEMRQNIKEAADAKEEQDGVIEEIKQNATAVSSKVEAIEDSMKAVDPETLSLPELKRYLIDFSKEALAMYLQNNPVQSSVHGGVTKSYSITAEKQNHLMAMILMATNMEEARLSGMRQYYETQYGGKDSITFEDFVRGVDSGAITVNGVTFNKYQPSWNATGEACTYDWTLAELKQLAAEIEAVVRPLISKQQSMEVQINAATSIEAAKAVNIVF